MLDRRLQNKYNTNKNFKKVDITFHKQINMLFCAQGLKRTLLILLSLKQEGY